ncbi:NHLP leader peptide family natural product precursor [Chryseobacterium manosquense]|uniref:NHLP leader peptide family natural product n=1 Tax=Chryseobacterium manosquense TaxID=2754694 RepID=A0A7H1DXI0_9FLAO|nr:NHLP leader peptide family RiPP precursor [Chryseobacterium manosquense]QNS41688.1 NHLP leader peptide family natural product precursor [Chryseobacterium manosquense]
MKLTNDEKILQEIVKRAWEDLDFKRNLIANPVETIEKFIGRPINLPQEKTLSVVDQTNSSVIYINLPAKLDLEDMELNEDQLDAVSGGDGIVIVKPNNAEGNIFGGS